MNNFIWIFGENEGTTMNNNSFFFWRHLLSNSSEEKCYFVVKKNKKKCSTFQNLPGEFKKKVIFKNSLKHTLIYKKADMFFVTHSYKDVIPNFYFDLTRRIKKPIIYLQHGTLGIKKMGYTGKSYWNNMFRFLIYNPTIKAHLINEHQFKDYQLHFAGIHPRYKKLVELNEVMQENKQILWFITWREYFGENEETKLFAQSVKKVKEDLRLINYLENEDKSLKICLHHFTPEDVASSISTSSKTKKITVVQSSQIDLIEEIANSSRLITDYSSLGFDFTFLKKPVLIYQFDQDRYVGGRDLYCHLFEDFIEINCKNIKELIDKIISEDNELNPFFVKRLNPCYDFELVKNGYHIDLMYEHFSLVQKNMITILDCGNISQKKILDLAEKFLIKGYLVELIILDGIWPLNCPPGLNIRFIFKNKSKNPVEFIRYKLLSKSRYYTINLLKKFIKYSKSKTIIVSDNKFDAILLNAKNNHILNKMKFADLSNENLERLFPNLKGEC